LGDGGAVFAVTSAQPVMSGFVVEKMHLSALGLWRRKFYSCAATEKK
jgi:hypothetical protein